MCLFALPALAGLAGAGGAAASAGGGLATALSAIGTVASAVGAVAGGVAQKNAADYNAQVEQNNAIAARQAAAYEMDMIRDDKKRVLAAQRAGGVSAGLEITQGSPLAVLGDSAKSAELDVLARKYSGDAQATASLNNAALQRAQGKAAMTAGVIGAGTTLLGGFGKLAARSPGRYSPVSNDPWRGLR